MSTTPTHIARYTVVQPIAAGGMGEVFLARDDRLDRLVAIKLLRDGFDNEELRGRFEEEARNVAKLTHPNIVTIYEYGAHEGRPYIAMEYVAGYSLADLIRGKMPLPLARRVRLIEELCSGLSHAHKAHLVHRDVKPANLMVTTSGMLKVLDFGIAKLRGTERTQAGMLVGTVNYMSPEQITGQPVDHRSDIFAVGLVLHELLTYDQAFKGNLTSAMFNIVHGQTEPLAVHCPGLDPGFQAVVNRCLAKRPEDRYHDLNLLKRDLARLRKPLEDDDVELADTIGPLSNEQTVAAAPRTAPATATQVRTVAGPDTRRALASAVAAGEAAFRHGEFASAVRHAEQALALEGGDAAALDLLDRARRAADAAKAASQVGHAREALQADHLDDARTALMTAAQLAPGSETVRDLAAQVERRAADLARFDEAVRDARALLDEGDFARARSLAETAVLILPDDSGVQRLQAAIDHAAAAAADAKRTADEAAREAERVERERREAEAARVEEERRKAEAARVEDERRKAAAARVEDERRKAAAARVEDERRKAEAARVEEERRKAEAARVEDERRLAALQAASPTVFDAPPEAAREAVTVSERGYWDEPTQTLKVPDLRPPETVAPSTSVREARVDTTATSPAARPALRPRAALRPRLMAMGGAAAVAVFALVWATRPTAPPEAAPDPPPHVVPPEAAATAADPTLTTTPLGNSGAPAGFRGPVESRPAAIEPNPVPTPGGVARPVASVNPVAPSASSGTGTPGAGSRPVVPPAPAPAQSAEPRAGTPPPVAAPPAPNAASTGATASPSTGPVAPPPGGATPGPATPGAPANNSRPAGGSSSGGSVTVPAPATPPVTPAVEAAAARQLDETTIRRLVSAFGQAYQSKDLQGLKAVWPEMNGRAENDYRDLFNSYRTISWVTGDTNIRFDGERADARSAVRVTQRALRPDTTTTQSRTYRFQFERRAKGWVLTGVENLGAAR